MKWIWIYFPVLFRSIFPIASIQTRIHRPIRFFDEDRSLPTRHFRHVDSSGANFDWERGLREATVRALFREHFGDGILRKHIYAAPLLGKRDQATPFGDIAVLARGQLYANYAGFIFVQDPSQNDCDNCHDIDAVDAARRACIIRRCQIWRPKNNEKLVALWTIKRIRHRSRQDGNRYEVEYAISPVGLRYRNGGYLTKEGTFNYDLPSHVFVLKSTDTHPHSDADDDQNTDHLKHGAFIAQTPDGRKYILHSFHGLLTPETPRYYDAPPEYQLLTSTSSSTAQYSEEDEKKIYQTLLDVLHKKTSPESTRFTPTSTTLSDKTPVQLPTGEVVPITELKTPFVTRTTPGYVTVRFPDANGIKAKPGLHKMSTEVTEERTVGVTASRKVTPQSYGILMPQTTPMAYQTTASTTSQNFLAHAESPTTVNEIPRTPDTVYPTRLYTTLGITRPQKLDSTLSAPPKTTFHFFAAEEAKKTTPEENPSSTTTRQEEYTENKNFLPDTSVLTEPSFGLVSKTTIIGPKEGTKYPSTSSTKPTFTTKSTSTGYRPATVLKITKPTEEATKSYSSVFTTSKTLSTSSSSTKIVPSIALEPPTSYSTTSKEPTTSYSTTSKEPHIFKEPITVLDESTIGSTLEQTYNYPTTQFEQVFTITQVPKTSHTEYEAPDGTTKYTTLQFYNPTTALTKLTSVEQGTTLFQAPVTDIEIVEPTRDTSLESTTFTRIPTLRPENGLIETTLGVTKMMGTAQNKTTEMVYYAAEETDGTIEESTPKLIPTTAVATVEPTYSILETKTTNPTTPKRIVTTIRADGTISVKTTPISADEELFGVTKGFTEKYNPTRRSPIATMPSLGNFLVDEGSRTEHKVPLFKKPSKDYSEDDIFGPTKSTTRKTYNKAGAAKHYSKSDLEQALFDTNNRKSKALIRRKSGTTESPSNVVYSDLFEVSTVPMTTRAHSTRNSFSVAKKQSVEAVTTERVPVATTILDEETATYEKENVMPMTSQSYRTSISFRVNKRKRLFDGKTTKNQKTVDDTVEIQERRPSTEPSYTASLENDFALRLVGHARGVEYLEQAGTTGASTLASTITGTTKKSKYTRRRSYTARAKRPTRKKIVKSRER